MGAGMGIVLRRQAAAGILLALVTISGCTDARPDDAAPTTPASSTAPTTPGPTADPQAAVKADVLAAYRGFWTAANAAERRPNRAPDALRRYASDKALAGALATVALYRQQGIVVRGQPVHDPDVVNLSLGTDPATALIRDCVDLTGVEAIYRETGKSALAPNQSRRHVATATTAMVNGQWVVREVAADRTTAC